MHLSPACMCKKTHVFFRRDLSGTGALYSTNMQIDVRSELGTSAMRGEF